MNFFLITLVLDCINLNTLNDCLGNETRVIIRHEIFMALKGPTPVEFIHHKVLWYDCCLSHGYIRANYKDKVVTALGARHRRRDALAYHHRPNILLTIVYSLQVVELNCVTRHNSSMRVYNDSYQCAAR